MCVWTVVSTCGVCIRGFTVESDLVNNTLSACLTLGQTKKFVFRYPDLPYHFGPTLIFFIFFFRFSLVKAITKRDKTCLMTFSYPKSFERLEWLEFFVWQKLN